MWPFPHQELESLYEELLQFQRTSGVNTDGDIVVDTSRLAAVLGSAAPKVLTYSKYARIAQGMLRSEARCDGV